MTSTIAERLNRLETEEGITIFFAVESGSRAWGFASKDSDFDVRFVYAHPRDWYISILDQKDTIEYPVDENLIDLSGWDLHKALKLFAKSNPPLLEWLKSPVVYKDTGDLRSRLLALERTYFSPRSSIHHYLHMAAGNYREYLQRDLVRVKKYFYVLRPILACEWIRERAAPPPMEFGVLVDSQISDATLKDVIKKLIDRKLAGDELLLEPRIPRLNDFIEERIAYYTEYAKTTPKKRPETDLLDGILKEYVR